ncbi:hypothetical protein DMENIID0001_007890 [Sergentomyia squamirostris]
MGKKPNLSVDERRKIDQLKQHRLSNRHIAEELKRSLGCINNYVKDPKNYGVGKSFRNIGGKKCKLTAKNISDILHLRSIKKQSAHKIREKLGLKISLRRVQQVISNSISSPKDEITELIEEEVDQSDSASEQDYQSENPMYNPWTDLTMAIMERKYRKPGRKYKYPEVNNETIHQVILNNMKKLEQNYGITMEQVKNKSI